MKTDMIQLPHCIDIERELLGTMLYFRDADFNMIFSSLSAEMFSDEAHGVLFDLQKACFLEHNRISGSLVCALAGRRQLTEKMGGEPYVADLIKCSDKFGNYKAYVKVIREKYILRELFHYGQDVYVRALSSVYDSAVLLADCSKELDRLMNLSVNRDRVYKSPEVMTMVTDAYAERKRKRENNEVSGLNTGLEKLDMVSGGLQPCDLILIAGRPSMGKTAFALFAAMNMARANNHVLIFTLEMSALQLGNRMLLSESNIPMMAFRDGSLLWSHEQQMHKTAKDIGARSITIADNSAFNMLQIRNIALRQKRTVGLDAVFIDYLQLISNEETSTSMSTRAYDLRVITKACKSLAMELNIPVVLLSQLNRSVESRADKRPMMSDLRDSGAIEEDADMVCLLYRESYYTKAKDYKGELIIDKFRNGESGTILFTHDEGMRHFASYDPQIKR